MGDKERRLNCGKTYKKRNINKLMYFEITGVKIEVKGCKHEKIRMVLVERLSQTHCS